MSYYCAIVGFPACIKKPSIMLEVHLIAYTQLSIFKYFGLYFCRLHFPHTHLCSDLHSQQCGISWMQTLLILFSFTITTATSLRHFPVNLITEIAHIIQNTLTNVFKANLVLPFLKFATIVHAVNQSFGNNKLDRQIHYTFICLLHSYSPKIYIS